MAAATKGYQFAPIMGTVNIPSPARPEAHAALERLLKLDMESHHCFFNKLGFHNHLNH